MAGSAETKPVSEGELIDDDDLYDLISTQFSESNQEFVVQGSVLDYKIDECATVLRCSSSNGLVGYELDFDWPAEFPEENVTQEKSRIQDSFLRAGIARHSNLADVMEKLRMQDDVIIGIDTNVLWDCILTSFLLDEIYKEEFPNWILIAVPRLVMAETENAANNTFGGSHPLSGGPVYDGRVGQRALQEVMDIREKNPDRPGIAMITVGDMDQSASVDRSNWKLDSLIRHQFQTFLDDISFHKGTYFLSQDRVNVMMSGTEGADGLYLQKPDLGSFRSDEIELESFTRLVYELCIQFGSLQLRGSDETDPLVELSITWPGKQVSDWRESKIELRTLRD